jgi:hypothetical protein
MPATTTEIRAIACNYLEATSAVRECALAFVIQHYSDGESIRILTRSRSGRWIEKVERRRKLGNYRPRTLPAEHPAMRRDSRPTDYGDAAAEVAQSLGGAS